jgi:hypothetical protein
MNTKNLQFVAYVKIGTTQHEKVNSKGDFTKFAKTLQGKNQ